MIGLLKNIYLATGIASAPNGSTLNKVHKFIYNCFCLLTKKQNRLVLPQSDWFFCTPANERPSKFPTESDFTQWAFFNLPSGWLPYFDIDHAISRYPIENISFIFFMGAGDFLYTTPLLKYVKEKYPHLKITAHISDHLDPTNSPLLKVLAETTPYIDEVSIYHGKNSKYWANYDYSAVTDSLKLDKRTLCIPVLYHHSYVSTHRVSSLFEQLNLPAVYPVPLPQVFPVDGCPNSCLALLAEIRALAKSALGIVFIQMEARSSAYSYPYLVEVIRDLRNKNYIPITVGAPPAQESSTLFIDLKKTQITESIQFLSYLNRTYDNLYILSNISVFWPISTALDIPHLSMVHFADDSVHNVWYPNIWPIVAYTHHKLPASRFFLATQDDYSVTDKGYFNFKPEYLGQCFDAFINRINKKK